MYRLSGDVINRGIDLLLREGVIEIGACLDAIYQDLDGYEAAENFHRRHMTPSGGVITIYDKQTVKDVLSVISDEIVGKVVVEIGAGVGLLALGMASIAKEVYAIEVDPAWSWAFTKVLYRYKQPNLTFIFGTAETMVGKLKADVAIIVSKSGHMEMQSIAKLLAKKVIDVYERFE